MTGHTQKWYVNISDANMTLHDATRYGRASRAQEFRRNKQGCSQQTISSVVIVPPPPRPPLSPSAGCHKVVKGGLHKALILLQHTRHVPPPLLDVTLDATSQAHIVICVASAG